MVAEPTRMRPTMVTVLGWIWIGLGSFATLTSVMVLVLSIAMGDLMKTGPAQDAGMPSFAGAALMEWMFRHFNLLAVGQLLIAILVLVAGMQLLRLRRWARTFLEGVCWLGLVYMVAFGGWWVFMWVGMAGQVSAGDANAPPAALMSVFGIGMMVMVVLFQAVPTGVLIWFLRHKTVRNAVNATNVEVAA